MNTFHYAQARLQARHSQHLSEENWSRLAAIAHGAIFLKQARETSLARWLHSIGPTTNHQEADRALRLRYREHVAEVASWLPEPWQPATRWLASVVDLPALVFLHGGGVGPEWMSRDGVLAPLVASPPQWGPYQPLLQRWQRGEPLARAWLDHWRSLWPHSAQKDAALHTLLALLQTTGQQLAACNDAATSRALHGHLQEQLANHFRRHLFHVSVAFAHLGLVALELERLRGAICRRLLFPTGSGEGGGP